LPKEAPAPAAPAAPAASAPGTDDFFGALGPAGEAANPGAEPAHLSGEPDRSLFDLPPPPPPGAKAPEIAAPEGAAPLEVEVQAPKPRVKAPEVRAPVTPQAPLGARVMSMVFNLLLVGVVGWGSLVGYATYRNDGHFDPSLLRPAELGRVILGAHSGPLTQLALEDVTNGLYPTAKGRQLFYVRGQVTNRGKAAIGPAQVKVEVVEGDKALASGRGWAGKAPTPERLYNLADGPGLVEFQAQQKADAEPVPPGGSRPFVVVLLDYPDDLAARTLRVSVELAPQVASK
jgi:hypothetical protein